MKKNKMMRAAVALMVVTLLTLSVVSGTFAKYVASGSGTDSARVAKFGVTVGASGTLFSKNYVNVTNGNKPGEANLTVKSEDTDKVVAPGTENGEGMTLSVTGKPEVDVKVTFNVETATDIHLGDDYYPVKFTLKKGTTALVTDGTLAEVKEELDELELDYAAGTTLDTTDKITLTWKWAFNGDDAKDTKLGNIAAGTEEATSKDSINTAFKATVTVTQVD
ncbi:MAG: hypothetical protein J1E41_05115 [Ruminococcus sp.]|nr:hypothetical protein [Ruminococcus sp.]